MLTASTCASERLELVERTSAVRRGISTRTAGRPPGAGSTATQSPVQTKRIGSGEETSEISARSRRTPSPSATMMLHSRPRSTRATRPGSSPASVYGEKSAAQSSSQP